LFSSNNGEVAGLTLLSNRGQGHLARAILTNAGLRTDISYLKGINNIKVGTVYQQTFQRDNDSLGVVYLQLSMSRCQW
jgi:hypothetical protein